MNRDTYMHNSNEFSSNVFYLFNVPSNTKSRNIDYVKTSTNIALNPFKRNNDNHVGEGEFVDMNINKRYEALCIKVCQELEDRFIRRQLDNRKLIAIVNRYDLKDSQRQFLMNVYRNRLTAISFYRAYKRLRKRVVSQNMNVEQLENLIRALNIDANYKRRMFDRLKSQIETKALSAGKLLVCKGNMEMKL